MSDVQGAVISHRATTYTLTWVEDGSDTIYLLHGVFNNAGMWIRLTEKSVSWGYLAEKVPEIARYGGDKEGWVLAFAEAGVKVFN